jgi:hypothetical protein
VIRMVNVPTPLEALSVPAGVVSLEVDWTVKVSLYPSTMKLCIVEGLETGSKQTNYPARACAAGVM